MSDTNLDKSIRAVPSTLWPRERKLVIESIDDELAAILRSWTPAQRLASAHAAWKQTRARLAAQLKSQFPNASDAERNLELMRRLLGAEDCRNLGD